jgi:hypothetical protein
MKSLVEAVANIVLFVLTPVIMVWVQISLAQVIDDIGGAANRRKRDPGSLPLSQEF